MAREAWERARPDEASMRDPRGNIWTAWHYLAEVDARHNRGKRLPRCSNGHDGCALWVDGPCGKEVAGGLIAARVADLADAMRRLREVNRMGAPLLTENQKRALVEQVGLSDLDVRVG